ncbi:hypothetical protein [Ralstonia pickettii]|uniref:hypothetical protein n=1 Tax=Ralstonia pickettii TaxID=329 RepID=UPI0015BF1780|nr:hypothetical protein [Ralstonia pickettii]NWK43455.1 hypothetical protein [Ralstonia pickettii]
MRITIGTPAAFIVSVLSLVVASWGAINSNQNAKVSARPYLVATPQLDGSAKKFGLYVSNAGPGAAVIKNAAITANGKRYEGLTTSIWPDFIRDTGLTTLCYRTGWPQEGSVLKTGEDDPLLVVSDSAPPTCQAEILRLLASKDLTIRIEYQSIFDETYVFERNIRFRDASAEKIANQLPN